MHTYTHAWRTSCVRDVLCCVEGVYRFKRDHRNCGASTSNLAATLRGVRRAARPPAFCWDEQSGITTTGMTVNTIDNGFYTAPALFQSQYTVTGNQLHFDLWVGGASFPNRMSELRVFTESVPAPGAIGLLGFAGLVARRRRR